MRLSKCYKALFSFLEPQYLIYTFCFFFRLERVFSSKTIKLLPIPLFSTFFRFFNDFHPRKASAGEAHLPNWYILLSFLSKKFSLILFRAQIKTIKLLQCSIHAVNYQHPQFPTFSRFKRFSRPQYLCNKQGLPF